MEGVTLSTPEMSVPSISSKSEREDPVDRFSESVQEALVGELPVSLGEAVARLIKVGACVGDGIVRLPPFPFPFLPPFVFDFMFMPLVAFFLIACTAFEDLLPFIDLSPVLDDESGAESPLDMAFDIMNMPFFPFAPLTLDRIENATTSTRW